MNSRALRCLAAAPFLQIRDAPTWGRAWSIILAGVQFLATDLLAGVVSLLAVAGAIDYFYGRKVALLQDAYDPLKADMGLHSKILGILLVLLVRGAEYWLGRIELMEVPFALTTHGLVAVGLTVLLLSKEFDSIDHHRKALGGQALPGFDQLLSIMRRFPTGKMDGDGQK